VTQDSPFGFVSYNVARREIKEVRKVRLIVFNDLYEKLDTKNRKKNIYINLFVLGKRRLEISVW
jgi:hypothetical protein